MRRLIIQAALVVMMAFSAVARADNFTLTWNVVLPSDSYTETLTFYLPPELLPVGTYGDGSSSIATIHQDGFESSTELDFFSPEDPHSGIGGLRIGDHGLNCDTCYIWFESYDALINDLSPGDPYIAGTHAGSYGYFLGDPIFGEAYTATLVITPDASAVPEPSSWLLLATGLLGLGVTACRKSRSQLSF
jgi:hypothetical protein